jgi:hypothetical protein
MTNKKTLIAAAISGLLLGGAACASKTPESQNAAPAAGAEGEKASCKGAEGEKASCKGAEGGEKASCKAAEGAEAPKAL